MANVMSDDRARAIVEKYRARSVDGQGVDARPPEWLTEMQADIANGINAAVSEALGREPVKPAVEDEPEDEPVKRTRNTTHMPATGAHASDARAKK